MRRFDRAEKPRLYAILDAEAVASRGADLLSVAGSLRRGGVRMLQYRDKQGAAEEVLANARALRAIFAPGACTLLLNDRAELVRKAGWDGVHVGQEDLTPAQARELVGEGRIVGLSTHTVEQARAAEADEAVDYVAIGPVFATTSKRATGPVVGLDGVRAVRAVVGKPLIAIGGIDEDTAGGVLDAGADCVAMIGALLRLAVEGSGGLRGRLAHLL